jgi:hypothetical protein
MKLEDSAVCYRACGAACAHRPHTGRRLAELIYFKSLFRHPASTFEPVLREERANLLYSLKKLGVTGEEISALES